ncbi:uncharacterized protein HMPREF1541_03186 [Cyphellophora europaea CBS 101466]|uniref:Uncharacterized protein n=1 Tax=Cyphellophora europaea (strain CBS 101466) TaxID=1220924 RepID=W2RXK0_CYPE1|nr:uncharacterized protein HMPREF1541_03186 [Cyphellophora europaea CBS 101466]ETN41251.1 hypothetical protein HMPREF1541_03186 [Cyphellophora europaea CBS 101466]
MLDIRGKWVSATFNLALLALSIVCYLLLVLLFVTPKTYRLDSLIHPNSGTIQPSVAVGLLSTALLGATSALITRCAEQSLWLRLSATSPGKNALTVEESHRLAQWSVSPFERLLVYPFKGSSWLLKFGGVVLFGVAAVNPVLLSGISQPRQVATTTEQQPATVPMVSNRLDVGNSAYRGGQARDNPTLIAGVAEMANLTASILDVCGDDNCHLTSLTTAIKAECRSTTRANPDGIGLISGLSGSESYPFCSTAMPDLCVTLWTSSPNTYANFSSYYHPDCLSTGACAPGVWCSLFGVWVSGTDVTRNSAHDIHAVECLLTFGNVTITQNGTNPPTLDRDSFVAADWSVREGEASFYQMNRIYTESGSENSPYSFTGGAVGTGDNTLYRNPIGYELLGTDANNGGEQVARQIERNFDRATLSAYAKQANASDLTVTRTTEEDLYVYQPKVLLVLVVPLLATLLGVWNRWSVGDEDRVVGYNPVEIARRGPVGGLPQGEILNEKRKAEFAKWKVWGAREEGSESVAVGYMAARDTVAGEIGSGNEGVTMLSEQPKRR